MTLKEKAFKKLSIISDFMTSHQPLDNPEELLVRLSDAQGELGQIETQFAEEVMKYKLELDKVKVPLEYQVMVLQQWHDELKEELVVLLKSRPRKTVDEHLHGSAFHSYGACPSVNDYENWLQDFEKKLEELLKE